MWRKATNEIDALEMISIAEQAEPKYYGLSDTDGAVENGVSVLLGQFENPIFHCFIYEDGSKKALIIATKEENYRPAISKCCAVGFGETLFDNYEKATPVVISKFRAIADELDIEELEAITPRTANGKTQVFFLQAYVPEAEISLMPDGMGWITVFKRSLRVDDEALFKLVKEPTLDAGIKPAEYVLKESLIVP